MPALVSFTSDFGTADAYVAAVKAVILGIAPGAQIVDVSHAVAPQAIAEAVFLAEQAWPYFPDGTVHLVVVDPGVGTARAAVALRTPNCFVVGPDNGVISAALPGDVRGAPPGSGHEPRPFQTALLPPGYELRGLSPRLQRTSEPAATFHGRDWFGPAAAFLAGGGSFEDCGAPQASMLVLPRFEGSELATEVRGRVIHVDRFGNLVSVIRAEQIPPGARTVGVEGRTMPLVRTYGDAEGLVALAGSGGYLEVALVNGSAAASLGIGPGALISVARA